MTNFISTRTLAVASAVLAVAVITLSIWWGAQTLWLKGDPIVIVDTTITINPGSFVSYELPLPHTSKVVLDVDVTDGSELDLFILSTVQFIQYQEAVRTATASTVQTILSAGGIRRIAQSVHLEPGTYVVVLDHTVVGPTRPRSPLASFFNHRAARVKVRITKE